MFVEPPNQLAAVPDAEGHALLDGVGVLLKFLGERRLLLLGQIP